MDSEIKRKHVTLDPNELNDLISPPQTELYVDIMLPLHARSGRRTLLKTGLGLVVAATGVGTWLGLHREATKAIQILILPILSTDNVVLQWNSAALQAIGNTSTGPTIGARALAIMHTCMYDAWSVYDAIAIATRPNGIPRQKSKWKDETEAVCYAAYRALMDLFPSQVAVFNAVMSNQGYDPSDTSTDTTTPSGVGNVAAQAVLTYRHNDGANQLNGYVDTTGYAPVNTPTQINDPNHWQPLLTPTGSTQKFLTPHWGQVTPFALTSGAQFRPTGPTVVSQQNYKAQTDAVLQLSAQLSDTSKVIAEYWADGPGTATPPGHWDLFSQFVAARFISLKNKHDINADIKLFFALTNAIFDASIACWDCKRAYDSARPVTAVHYLYSGQNVTAWAGPGKGTQSIDGGAWRSYLSTPSFAEYVSGHSTFSATGAYILSETTGLDLFGDSYIAAPGSSTIEPGITPSTIVPLLWPTFSGAAVQAGMSRRYGGIHFQQADEDGRALGYNVAPQAWAKAQSYIQGTV
jgi:hypothetical protein